ncbi:beta-glucosidase family protein [Paludibacterium yongneupense]|uniref:beta-glucosidase family protein n=1 Tax=Paludibacterium yongneupense TaxID=400061 RepID=UPI000423E49F|nr:glycoside hydrolase family 3 C-terminal domain-containing protein [Paludibacterium yongneupense]
MHYARLSLLTLALLSIGFGSAHAAPFATDAAADAQAATWVRQMTLDEKIQLVHGAGMGVSPVGGASYIPGIPRLGIPALASADSAGGVGGLNVPDSKATQFPAPLALAASWNPELAHAYGRQIALELRALGFGEGLGGGIDLAREPRNGRTFEYMGEDPVLAGLLSAARTRGTQEQNVIATVKHFAANDQETKRFTSNSIIDERTLRELSLLPFEIAVKDGGVGNVMCSYNLLNGIKACQNPYLLTDTLKNEWGFKGTVQSDWIAAVNDTVPAVMAGLDEEEPGSSDDNAVIYGVHSHFNQWLKAAVQSGQVPMSRLDDMVARKLRTLVKFGIVANPPKAGGTIDVSAARALAQKVAEQSMVLLKNHQAALPLDPGAAQTIVLIGGHADVGVMAGGGSGGSGVQSSGAAPSANNPVACLEPKSSIGDMHMMTGCATYFTSSPLAAFKARAPKANISYVDGHDAAAAANAAAKADVAIVFATQWTSEDMDLPSLALPNAKTDPANQSYDQEALIRAVAAKSKRTIVVLENGSAVTMPWLTQVSAVLDAWYPGMEGGPALARVLFGDVNPSGKLPLTFPKAETDLPQKQISTTSLDVVYKEGLQMGYRWYDARKIEPLFAFGYGLSYTRFAYSGIKSHTDAQGRVTVSFTLKNTGDRAGAEVAQVYAALPASAGEPPKRLVGWKKVELAAGLAQRIDIDIAPQRLAIWNVHTHQWQLPAGRYGFEVGGSSRAVEPLLTETRLTGSML